jgi:hypothetical protein
LDAKMKIHLIAFNAEKIMQFMMKYRHFLFTNFMI